jgi:hypothetical protein
LVLPLLEVFEFRSGGSAAVAWRGSSGGGCDGRGRGGGVDRCGFVGCDGRVVSVGYRVTGRGVGLVCVRDHGLNAFVVTAHRWSSGLFGRRGVVLSRWRVVGHRRSILVQGSSTS